MTHSPRKHQVDPSLSSETANKPISPSKTKTSPLIKTIPNSEKSPTKTLVSPRDTRVTSKSDFLHLPQKHISTPTMVNTKSKQISIESFIQKSTTTTTTASSLTQSVHISPTATVSSVSPRMAAASKLLKPVTSPYVPNIGSVLEKTEKGVVILDKGQREAIESNFSLNQGYLTAFESFTSTLGHDKSKPTLRPDIASGKKSKLPSSHSLSQQNKNKLLQKSEENSSEKGYTLIASTLHPKTILRDEKRRLLEEEKRAAKAELEAKKLREAERRKAAEEQQKAARLENERQQKEVERQKKLLQQQAAAEKKRREVEQKHREDLERIQKIRMEAEQKEREEKLRQQREAEDRAAKEAEEMRRREKLERRRQEKEERKQKEREEHEKLVREKEKLREKERILAEKKKKQLESTIQGKIISNIPYHPPPSHTPGQTQPPQQQTQQNYAQVQQQQASSEIIPPVSSASEIIKTPKKLRRWPTENESPNPKKNFIEKHQEQLEEQARLSSSSTEQSATAVQPAIKPPAAAAATLSNNVQQKTPRTQNTENVRTAKDGTKRVVNASGGKASDEKSDSIFENLGYNSGDDVVKFGDDQLDKNPALKPAENKQVIELHT